MKRKILFLGIISFISVMLHQAVAVPAYPYPVEVTQPDGTTLTITLKGDEFASWAESADGYTLLRNSDGFFEYAQKDAQGELVLSGVIARNVQQRTLNDNELLQKTPKKLGFSDSQAQMFRQLREIRQQALDKAMKLRSSQSDDVQQSAPAVSGTIRLPFILVDFPGKPFTKTKQDYQLLCNQTGGLHDYFLATSYNQLDLQIDVYGPYTLANPIAYYDYQTTGNANQTVSIMYEAVTFALANGCNFANYDSNSDGIVDAIHIIFAGYDQSAGAPKGSSIWASAWSTSGFMCVVNNKFVTQFSMSSELRGISGQGITPIGVIAHELSHVFGLPDLYDTDYSGSGGTSIHIDQWCIMASGSWNNNGDTPPHHSAWCKDQLGWVKMTELIDPAYITIPNPAVQGASYKITTKTPNEYFLLENRQKQGWDAYIPSSGMLIYHVDENYINSHKSSINASPAHRGLYIKQAGGNATSTSTTRTTDPYPQGANNSFTDTSVPNSKSWAGVNTVKSVTNITHNTSAKTISFVFKDGAPEPVTNFVATVDGDKVVLNWTPSVTSSVIAYKIYRDGVFQYTVSGLNSDTYTQFNVPNGTHEYSITAFDGIMESAKVYDTALVVLSTNTSCTPVYNLKADASVNDKVKLTWDATTSNANVWKAIYSGSVSVRGAYASTSMVVGRKWLTSDLSGMNGFLISHVKFRPYEQSSGFIILANYSVVIYSVTGGEMPVEVYQQPITQSLSLSQLNDIKLNTPVVIDISKEWIIGIRYDLKPTASGLAFYADTQTNNDPRNVCYTKYYGWEPLSAWSVSGNPYMEVYFEGEAASGYLVYRDGELLGNTATREYTDNTVDECTIYSYCVAAQYTGSGCVSEPVCVETKSKGYEPVRNLQISLTTNKEVELTWEAPLTTPYYLASPFLLKATSAGAVLQNYSIYRNDVGLLETINSATLSYTDEEDLETGLYEYCVEANYDLGNSKKVSQSIQVDKTGTGLKKNLRENVSVYCKYQTIYAVSTATDLIRKIEIYDMQGRRVYVNDKVNAATYTINNNVSLPEICVVRLITEKRVMNVKIVK